VRDDLDVLVQMIVYDDRVAEHKDRLGDAERVAQLSGGLGLKVLDAVVGHVADRTA
jgi:hypothetical protein